MIIKLLTLLLVLIIFFSIKYLAYKITVDWYDYIPNFLRELPYVCGDCLQTHMMWITYLCLSYIFNWNLTILIAGLGLTLLNTIAIFYRKWETKNNNEF